MLPEAPPNLRHPCGVSPRSDADICPHIILLPYAWVMPRLQAHVDPALWVPVTESFGFRGRRTRKRAIQMLIAHATQAVGAAGSAADNPKRGKTSAWILSQFAPVLMRKAAGRVLVWVWKKDPELAVVIASVQQATPQSRAARAMRPMEEDDTESFRHPTLGVGERLVLDKAGSKGAASVSYTWDLQTHFVEVSAMGDPLRLRTILGDLDELVRSIRVLDDMTLTEQPTTLRLPPAS